MLAGRLSTGPDEREVAAAAAASQRVRTAGAADLLLDGLITRYTEGYAPSVAPLSRALARVRSTRRQRRRRALAVAGLPPCTRALGRRPLVHARNTR